MHSFLSFMSHLVLGFAKLVPKGIGGPARDRSPVSADLVAALTYSHAGLYRHGSASPVVQMPRRRLSKRRHVRMSDPSESTHINGTFPLQPLFV